MGPVKLFVLSKNMLDSNHFWNFICFHNINTTSWGPGKHSMSPPGCRPLFLKPKCHKESKNGFKPINFRSPLQVIFSNYFFWYQKLSKNGLFVDFWNFIPIYSLIQKNSDTFASVYSSECVTIFLNQTLINKIKTKLEIFF